MFKSMFSCSPMITSYSFPECRVERVNLSSQRGASTATSVTFALLDMITIVPLASGQFDTRRLDRKLRRLLQHTSLSPIYTRQQSTLGLFVIPSLPCFLAQSSRDQIISEANDCIFRCSIAFCQITVNISVIHISYTGSRDGRSFIPYMCNDMCRHCRVYVTPLLASFNWHHY